MTFGRKSSFFFDPSQSTLQINESRAATWWRTVVNKVIFVTTERTRLRERCFGASWQLTRNSAVWRIPTANDFLWRPRGAYIRQRIKIFFLSQNRIYRLVRSFSASSWTWRRKFGTSYFLPCANTRNSTKKRKRTKKKVYKGHELGLHSDISNKSHLSSTASSESFAKPTVPSRSSRSNLTALKMSN